MGLTDERLAEIRTRIGLMLNEAEVPYARGGNGSHWAECWRSHIDCLAAFLSADASELLTEVGRLRGEQERLREALQRRIDADAEGEPIDPSYDGEGCDCFLCAEDRALLRALVGEQNTTTSEPVSQ